MISNGFATTGLSNLNPDNNNFNKIIKSKADQETDQAKLTSKLSNLKHHLTFLEGRIGLERMRDFNARNVNERDEGLFEIWKNISNEVEDISKKIADKATPSRLIETPRQETPETSSTIQERVDVIDAIEEVQLDENEDLDAILPFDEGMILAQESLLGGTENNQAFLQQLTEELGIRELGDCVEVSVEVHEAPVTEQQITTSSPIILQPRNDSRDEVVRTPTNDRLTPRTTTPVSPNKLCNKKENVPSPFKRCLFWPEPSTSSGKKRKIKEKIPSVITSEEFKQYIQKKEDEKKKKEVEQEIKRLRREALKVIKQEESEQKKKKIKKTTEVEYSEDEDSDSEGVKLISSEERNNLSVNNWVVVPYVLSEKKQYFVGQIKSINNKTAAIKFLSKKGGKYIWPEDEDIDNDVPFEEIVQLLSVPTLERRGFFTFRDKIIQ